MFEHAKLSIKYSVDGTKKVFSADNDDVTVKKDFKNGLFNLYVETKKPISIENIALTVNYNFTGGTVFFGNGHQSWTDTREYVKADKMRDLGAVGKDGSKFQFWQRLCGMNGSSLFKKNETSPLGPIFINAGDYRYARYTNRRGYFHSISYTYVKENGEYTLIGSLNEKNGYTVIYADMPENRISVEKDLEGVVIDGAYHVFSLLVKKGGYDEIFDAYFGKMGAEPRAKKILKGYTSWYNYYQDISEEIILRDLDALTAKSNKFNTFQIDDGYQTAVGDWLSVDGKKFPNGMKTIADAIHKKGLKAGLWLAPLGAQLGSKVLAEHPEWFIKNEKGENLVMGPNWGGFCGLNFYLPEVREHIKHFFDVVLNEWGYDLVKLDFLYAASVIPLCGKSRAENMYDAINFIRECVGEKEILGCGVPIIPCVNKVEYMRIGADMGLSWSQFIFGMTTHREDVNTRGAIHNGLNRRHLNGRVFLNDPDVFLLRGYNIGLKFSQRKLIATLIKLTGGVLFTSDDVNRYGEEQNKTLEYMLSDAKIKIRSVDFKNNSYTVRYTENGEDKTLKFSLFNGAVKRTPEKAK
ncbi:MAG: alpha-galactosidase [Clostridiales bacterium]|jgi:alpha-galactosidase|nr:alpha-galactosidase [Clostridiales bacterium]